MAARVGVGTGSNGDRPGRNLPNTHRRRQLAASAKKAPAECGACAPFDLSGSYARSSILRRRWHGGPANAPMSSSRARSAGRNALSDPLIDLVANPSDRLRAESDRGREVVASTPPDRRAAQPGAGDNCGKAFKPCAADGRQFARCAVGLAWLCVGLHGPSRVLFGRLETSRDRSPRARGVI